MSVGEHHVAQADLVERAEDVGAELDAGADLLELRRLLEHPHREALARQRMGRSQPANAAACDQERFLVLCRHLSSRTSDFRVVLVTFAGISKLGEAFGIRRHARQACNGCWSRMRGSWAQKGWYSGWVRTTDLRFHRPAL